MDLTADWLVPDWPAPPQVLAFHTTRAGGVSAAPYDSMNLGDHVGDQASAVAANRRRLAQASGANAVFLRQVHGAEVVRLPTDAAVPAADACLSQCAHTVCTIMVADCLPVLFTDGGGRIVAAAHAGWRGLAGGVLDATVAAMRQALHATDRAPDLLAWLGPCIGPDAFEVGDEVRAAFVARDPQAGQGFRTHGRGKWLADLPGLARGRLQALGVTRLHGNDGSLGWCTVANASRFFSHRRDRVSGRMAACIWLSR